MKKVEAERLGSFADYHVVEAPIPDLGSDQVLIDVAVCGVGFVDALIAGGRYQVKPSLPHTPGQEVAGRIVGVGDRVDTLRIGDRVLATSGGGFAETVACPVVKVVKLPDKMSFAQAAGFPVNYLTALHGLRDRARLQAGERLLVFGAAGGVGAAAIQVGKRLGANVVAAASSEEKRAFALAQGADAAIDTGQDGWRDRLKHLCGEGGVDVVFDPVCGPLFEPAFRSLVWCGRYLVVGFAAGAIPALPANLSLMKGAELVGVDLRQFLLREPAHAEALIGELMGWVTDGDLVPPVGRAFPLEEFADALEFALGGRGLGKTLLNVSQALAENGEP